MMTPTKKRILVIRDKPLKYFIQSVPAFAAIRKFYPEDNITILTDNSLIALCKASGFFNRGWVNEKAEWLQFKKNFALLKKLRAANFDMVYDLQNDKRSEWYFRLIGFKKPNWNSSVIDWCSHYYKVESNEISFQDIIHNQLKVAGVKSTPNINISFLANNEANELPEKFAMICSGGDREKIAHKWDPMKYAEVIDYLHEKHNITSVLIGDGYDDMAINNLVASQCVKAKPINFSGKTSVQGIIAVATKALFCLGNETAPVHIAAYTGCKTIMLCSRFSPFELVLPKVKNLAAIEELYLENVDINRTIDAIEQFGLVGNKNEFNALRTIDENIQ